MLGVSPRRLLRGAVLVLALAVAFGGGVVTGVVGSSPSSARSGDRADVIDEAAARIQDRAAEKVGREELERAAVEGMLRALGDRWSTYFSPAEYGGYRESLEGRYSGVGLWLREGSRHRIVVASVQPSSPASDAGVRRDDRVVSVDGHAVRGATVAAVAAWLRGPDGTTVTLSVRRDGGPRSMRLERHDIRTRDVTLRRLGGHVLRIGVAAFTRGVSREVDTILARHRAAARNGIVLDLRDDPGGLVEEAVGVASAFLDGGPVVTYERRGRGARTLDAAPGGDTTTALVVLVNQNTASAAELLAASLQDRNRAVVVGTRTFGKGSVQEPSRLSDGSALALTVGRYFTPRGRSVEGVGVEPDVEVPRGAPPKVAERRATEVLSGLVASLPTDGRG